MHIFSFSFLLIILSPQTSSSQSQWYPPSEHQPPESHRRHAHNKLELPAGPMALAFDITSSDFSCTTWAASPSAPRPVPSSLPSCSPCPTRDGSRSSKCRLLVCCHDTTHITALNTISYQLSIGVLLCLCLRPRLNSSGSLTSSL